MRTWVKAVSVLGVLAFVGSSPVVRGGVVYQQPSQVGSGSFSGLTSSRLGDTSDTFFTRDDFQLAADATITSVAWQGTYLQYDSVHDTVANGSPDTLFWNVSIYTRDNTPGFHFSLVGQSLVGANDPGASRTLAGTTDFLGATVDYYDFSLQLEAGVALSAGQTYYLAVYSISSIDSSNLWSWFSGSGGNGESYQFVSSENQTQVRGGDRTFTLYSDSAAPAVPEPSSLLLAALGAAGVAGLANRRRPR
ncbi:MAG: PEP-CTERM sorting domain-containing protein [Paludisphaera borealis]|uniref:PEP-CTERM sorting domain-containing protein n=1 Tax=Paludisphaera borealis TaxID=1387353 RepID=UPI0028493E0C|nr:PEP-CTERM sorting domain-containing protein [Paludisphaera borealis]MDR3622507.1 PEP-CTERM sorting domain-containing protein [Paludisphaera borealis]